MRYARPAYTSCLVVFTLLLALGPLVGARLIVTLPDNRTLSMPTYDYYELDPPDYGVTAKIHMLEFARKVSCSLRYDEISVSEAKSAMQANSAIVLMMYWGEAAFSNCLTVAQAAEAAKAYSDKLGSEGLAVPKLLLLAIDPPEPDIPQEPTFDTYDGSQYTLPYMAPDISVPDGTPSMTTIILPTKNTEELVQFLGSEPWDSITATINKERGPWNDVLFSQAFTGVKMFFWALNGSMLLYSLLRLGLVLRKRIFVLNHRNGIFLLYAVSCPFQLVSMSMIMQSEELRNKIVGEVGYLMSDMASYLLLLLWERLLTAIRSDGKQYAFRFVVYTVVGLRITSYGIQTITSIAGMAYWMKYPAETISYGVEFSWICLCILFAYHWRALSPAQCILETNKQTYAKMRQLCSVAIANFISYFIMCALTIMSFIPPTHTMPTINGLMLLLDGLSSTIQAIAFLILLGVQESY
ncbi:hypothetical protein THASP1DRAFT_26874 [Thamnocephalis sphaerospora]|uniref:Lung seven transmembrane receptor-domain-containing protein n=1 Tax=Thamnocephalis sphaerospora TaxID=78915 RepID=A0A4P9XGZ0_9FUNG|nr:hypothetical protein THASP1DRAFT_26874 [Thamnocephalis sphaerospora]|eukprot:RKP04521.1 hypothetical protein THASP1DRAFT_26874 [Thamnocephalis sphaerospora]